MFRVAYFLKRKPGTSLEEFKERYESGHAALCRQSLARDAQEFTRKYLRPRRAGVDKDAKEPPDAAYDSIVELAFATRAGWDETLGRLGAADIEALATDEAAFTDRSRRLACVVDEHISPIGDVRRDHLLHWRAGSDMPPTERAAAKARGMARGASLFKRKPGTSHEAFKDYYETRHVLIGYRYVTYNAILYSRKFLRPLTGDPLAERGSAARDTPYDVFMELSYEVAEDRQKAVAALTPADIEQIAADEARFMDRSDRLAFTVDGPYQDAGKTTHLRKESMSRTTTFLLVTLAAAAAVHCAPGSAQTTAKQAYAQAVPTDAVKRMSAADKLLAMEEIRQLSLRYGRCITQKDWECVRKLFTTDFVMGGRATGPEGFIEVMRSAGTYDRVMTVLRMHGAEIEMLSPTTARGIVAADFTFYMPPGGPYQLTGKEVVGPGQQTHTDTFYYHTYEKVNGVWQIKTLDHVSFDLRTDFSGYTKMYDGAFVTPEGVPAVQR